MICIYGPPGSGKSTLGRLLAQGLDLPFYDLDEIIQSQSGSSIPELFAAEGEAGFRKRERQALAYVLDRPPGVVALGGGALLDAENRSQAEAAGPVLCVTAPADTLLSRLETATERPLLSANIHQRLPELLAERAAHYASFPAQLDTQGLTPEEAVWEAQLCLGIFSVQGMGPVYEVRVQPGGLRCLGEALAARGLQGPLAIVSDENVGELYLSEAKQSLQAAGFAVHPVLIPPGEQHKTIASVTALWEAFIAAGIERRSTVIALGGGVIGDLAGFAAATFLRGVPWVAVPTSLLAMVDASLGGKTGADLPQGKNLIGAFHPPRLVLADPNTLETLPEAELRSGMAEVVKAGVIGDPDLFARCARGWRSVRSGWDEIVRRAMAVKIRVIQADPFEKGERAALNLGHTLGHAIEQASGFQIRHGEAVAIGMAAAARLSERMGLADPDLAAEIQAVLSGLDLPTEIPSGLKRADILAAMRLDKKRAQGSLRFVLPVRIGAVKTGVEVADLSWLFDRQVMM